MTNELSPLQSVQDSIRDRIKAEFVNLIPDEMWTKMVSEVVENFQSKKDNRGYDQEPPVKKMIREAIEAQAKDKIAEALSQVMAGTWDNFGQQVVGDAMQELIAKHFDVILKEVQSGMVSFTIMQTVNHMRNSINNNMR